MQAGHYTACGKSGPEGFSNGMEKLPGVHTTRSNWKCVMKRCSEKNSNNQPDWKSIKGVIRPETAQPAAVVSRTKSSVKHSSSEKSGLGKGKRSKKVVNITNTQKQYDWIDKQALRRDCNRIEIVHHYRNNKDKSIRIGNLDILGTVYVLVTTGGSSIRTCGAKTVEYVAKYLCNHSTLVSQIAVIISEAESLHVVVCAIRILYQLLVANEALDMEKVALKRTLSSMKNFSMLVESMHTIHQRFAHDPIYKQNSQQVHYQLLNLIMNICTNKDCRMMMKEVSKGTMKFLSKLTASCPKNKFLAYALVEILRMVLARPTNASFMISKKFLDGVCSCYYLTRKYVTIPFILGYLSKNETGLEIMSAHEKVISMIMELVCFNIKRVQSRRSLMTTLNRIASNKDGLEILSGNVMFSRLFHYFCKVGKDNMIRDRVCLMKAYSILNRAANRTVLPVSKLKINLQLPDLVKKALEEEATMSEDSDSNNDDDSQDEDDSIISDDANVVAPKPPKSHSHPRSADNSQWEILTDICPFFVEYLINNRDTNDESIFRFDIFDGITPKSLQRTVELRTNRGLHRGGLAFPDALMLDPESDDATWNSSTNDFPIDYLAYKLKVARGTCDAYFARKIIYDLDAICSEACKPIVLPHPSTFKMKQLSEPAPDLGCLKFESRFESGNLRKAIQTERFEYELQMTPDMSTNRGLQWFYFQVSNMVHNQPYVFNITNFLKIGSQYNHGMQPLMFSITDYVTNGVGWKRIGEAIAYYGNDYTDEEEERQYKTLSFTVTFEFSNDICYFAYHYPYTYSRLMVKLFPLIKYKISTIYVRLDRLCYTVSGKNEMALITITGSWNHPNSLGVELRKRPVIFITGRVHPGETNSSWIMEGLINFLLNETNEDAIAAREHFVFKIIPMLNPEGVIYGNARNGLTGSDLNRCWARPSKATCPEIYNPKRLIACARKELKVPIAAYIDIHGHSRKKFFFFYGCNPKASWNKYDKHLPDLFDTLKIVPEMIRNLNPNINLQNCSYKVIKNREATGRVVMWREFDIKHSYTLECSYSFASDNQCVNTKILTNIGGSVAAAFGRIAEKAYLSKSTIPSLNLDYSYISTARMIARPLPVLSPKDKNDDYDQIEEHLQTISLNDYSIDSNDKYPIIVNARVYDTVSPRRFF